jgi:Insulin-induced protein (INSIG)
LHQQIPQPIWATRRGSRATWSRRHLPAPLIIAINFGISTTMLFAMGMAFGVVVTHLHDTNDKNSRSDNWQSGGLPIELGRGLSPVRVELAKSVNTWSWAYLLFWGLGGVLLGWAMPLVDELWTDDRAWARREAEIERAQERERQLERERGQKRCKERAMDGEIQTATDADDKPATAIESTEVAATRRTTSGQQQASDKASARRSQEFNTRTGDAGIRENASENESETGGGAGGSSVMRDANRIGAEWNQVVRSIGAAIGIGFAIVSTSDLLICPWSSLTQDPFKGACTLLF